MCHFGTSFFDYRSKKPCIYLLYAYPKNVQVNLSESEKKAFAGLTAQLKQVFRKKDGKYHE